MKKIILLVITTFAICVNCKSSNYPFRVSLKFGIPNLAGLSGEYVLPIGWDKFALSVDYSYLPLKLFSGHVISNFTYISGDLKIYPFKKGPKGWFLGIGMSKAKYNLDFEELITVPSGLQGHNKFPWVKLKWDDINFGVEIDYNLILYKTGYRLFYDRFTF